MGLHGTITPDIVNTVKSLLKEKRYFDYEIAMKMNISEQTVYHIKTGRYDTGVLVKKKNKVRPGIFNDNEKNWIL